MGILTSELQATRDGQGLRPYLAKQSSAHRTALLSQARRAAPSDAHWMAHDEQVSAQYPPNALYLLELYGPDPKFPVVSFPKSSLVYFVMLVKDAAPSSSLCLVLAFSQCYPSAT